MALVLVHALGGIPAGMQMHLEPPEHQSLKYTTACILLQHVKRIFEGCNYVNSALKVGMFWSVKFVMRLRDPGRATMYTDMVESTEDFTTKLTKLAETSPLVAALLMKPLQPYATRSIFSVTRERMRIERGDWLLVTQEHQHVIARVRDLAQCLLEGEQHAVTSVVRMWCDACVEPRIGDHGETWAPRPPADGGRTMLVCMEDVKIGRKMHALPFILKIFG